MTTVHTNIFSNANCRVKEIPNEQRIVTKSSELNGIVSNIDDINIFDALSPKHTYPSSDVSVSTMKPKSAKKLRERNTTSSSSDLIEKYDFKHSKDYRTTTIGSITLTWPPYGINNASYRGQRISVFHTCPIDAGLFVFYYAYKVGTDKFRSLFDSNTLDSLKLLRRIFYIVDNEG